jgi:small conductance mechanosensitive channel
MTTTKEITQKTLENFVDKATNTVPDLFSAIIIFIIGLYIAKWIKKIVALSLSKYHVGKGLSNFIVYGIYIAIIAVIVITCLDILGIQTTSVVAVFGAAGFSIGLAFKEILANIGSGMIILFFKPFAIGDYVQGTGVEGQVHDIQVFSTVLKTNDNKTVIIPNSQMTTNNIINYTKQEKRRVDFSYNVSYNTDIELIKRVLNDIFREDERILQDPKPIIGINSMSNNAMQIVARPWVKTSDYWDVYFDVMEKVKKKFDENNIELAIFVQQFKTN